MKKLELDAKQWAAIEAEIDELVPPEPPGKPQLPLALTAVLLERCNPAKAFIARYAKLINDAGNIIEVDTAKLDAYRADLELASYSAGLFSGVSAVCLLDCINKIAEAERYDADGMARQLYTNLSLTGKEALDDAFNDLDDMQASVQFKTLKADIDRLKSEPAELAEQIEYYKGEVKTWETLHYPN